MRYYICLRIYLFQEGADLKHVTCYTTVKFHKENYLLMNIVGMNFHFKRMRQKLISSEV